MWWVSQISRAETNVPSSPSTCGRQQHRREGAAELIDRETRSAAATRSTQSVGRGRSPSARREVPTCSMSLWRPRRQPTSSTARHAASFAL